MDDAQEVAQVFFNKTSLVELGSLELHAMCSVKEFHITENFIATHSVAQELKLSCTCLEIPLTIHPDAFTSSSNTAKDFEIVRCDLKDLDFSFFSGLPFLQNLRIENSLNIGKARWDLIPHLPVLRHIYLFEGHQHSDESFNEGWSDHFPFLLQGLTEVILIGIKFPENEIADRFVQWLVDSSAKTLQTFRLDYGHSLTRFPRHLSDLKNLQSLTVHSVFYFEFICHDSLPLEPPDRPIAQVFEQRSFSDPYVSFERFAPHPSSPDGQHQLEIPAQFLASEINCKFIKIKCSSVIISSDDEGNVINKKKMRLAIDLNAFSPITRNSAQYLWIEHCDLSGLDFSFLTGFNQLQELIILHPSNIGKAKWDLLPPLPALQHLYIDDGEFSNNTEWAKKLPPLVHGLSEIHLIGMGMARYEIVESIFQWLLISSSETLKILEISSWHNLTRLPSQLPLFPNLNHFKIDCSNFEIAVIKELWLPSGASKIKIEQCGVLEIEPGAVRGIIHIRFKIYFSPHNILNLHNAL